MAVQVRLAQGENETGATCLGMVLAAHGLHVGQEELRMVCGVSRNGTDLHVLARAAETYGLVTEISEADQLPDASLPLIGRWGNAQIAVIDRHHGDTWGIVDPIEGRSEITAAQLAARPPSQVLAITPGPEFRPSPRLPGMVSMLASRAARTKAGIAYVVIAGLALIVPGVAAPAFIRLFVDSYLSGGDSAGVHAVILGLVTALAFTVVLTTLQLLGLRRQIGRAHV